MPAFETMRRLIGAAAALAVPLLAFAAEGTPAGHAELTAATETIATNGALQTARLAIRAGHKTIVAALGLDGVPLATGHYHPAGGTTEVGGIGTLPSARSQGLAAAVTVALSAHAREHGVRTIFLAYAKESVARIYARLGFLPADTTLLIANQPARS